MNSVWIVKEKDKKSQRIHKNGSKLDLRTSYYLLTDPHFEFFQGNNGKYIRTKIHIPNNKINATLFQFGKLKKKTKNFKK